MNLENFNPDEFINQFNVKLENEGATPEESRAFKMGVYAMVGGFEGLLEKGATTSDLTTICKMFGKELKGGCDD
ncbi:hypothetical protein [Marinifilum flexuosum]|uniref:Uncharacterized protein n=1 Tax=Marinifilum flexuosum TaxID=1117708 RepID=A0A419WMR7_9BACT|nr:hypothetical protein [Marinifilum flexuosum]RKD96751.1 hypothetical protein BXY64_3697 [Marinifilum flexuosum]